MLKRFLQKNVIGSLLIAALLGAILVPFLRAQTQAIVLHDGEELNVVCECECLPTPTITPEPTATNTPLPTATATEVPTPTPTFPPTPTASPTPAVTTEPSQKLVGIFDYLPTTGWPSITLSRLNHDTTYLEQARQADMHALVALTGGHGGYTTDGDFDLDKWKARLDSRDLEAIQAYVDDGTIVGLYAIDEPHDWGGGAGPTFAELDAACEYAHQVLPGIACGFNTPPSWLQPGAPYNAIDFIFTQTNFGRAPTPTDWIAWAQQQFDTAASIGIEPVFLSINAATGTPSAAQVQAAGEALCQFPVEGVMAWKWSYVTGMQSAFDAIAESCAESP